jgi:hypothetical protein
MIEPARLSLAGQRSWLQIGAVQVRINASIDEKENASTENV